MLSYDRKISGHENYIIALKNQEQSLKNKIKATTNASIKRRSKDRISKIEPKKLSSEKRIKELIQEKTESNAKFDEDLAFFRKNKG